MTAAALKPDLFNHLFASRPEDPDGSSLTASVMSLVLHGLVVVLAIWASVSLERTFAQPVDELIAPVIITAPNAADPVHSRPAAGPAGAGVPMPRFEIPREIINDPGVLTPVNPDYSIPIEGPPSSGGNNGSPGVGPGGRDVAPGEGFTVLSVMPDLLNRVEVQRALQRNYPPLLRDAGIGGTAVVWLLLGPDGRVTRTEVKETSGHGALDDAALRVAPIMRFSPAKNRDENVSVWVAVPLVFRTR